MSDLNLSSDSHMLIPHTAFFSMMFFISSLTQLVSLESSPIWLRFFLIVAELIMWESLLCFSKVSTKYFALRTTDLACSTHADSVLSSPSIVAPTE
ncbi:hypothetical protein PRUPE_3G041200 [Prunus persica]|uniref:Uncharacterized protein n=1 Tax=Prunus persica TaxID=3760 RepID=A0A251PUY7_PRUPE|nr:hypothetical protein PRUPE_3G041200 [Prunus persica]